ncbi:hypothetical protein ACLMJK_001163 [Lecanora helva]
MRTSHLVVAGSTISSAVDLQNFLGRGSQGSQPKQNSLFPNSFGLPFKNASYDYVVVGGGTAGLTIASKLAQEPSLSVAVIEAGSFYQLDNGNGSVVPALIQLQHIGSDPSDTAPLIDWDFVTEPQAASAALKQPLGTVGSYQKWANEVGDRSYTFDKILPFFKKSCHLTPPDSEKRWPTNGTVDFDPSVFDKDEPGPLQVSWPNWAIPIGTWAREGLKSLGIYPSQIGFSSGTVEGSGYAPAMIDPASGHRSSSQTSFLAEAMAYTSLKVYSRTIASKVTFDSNGVARGVQVETAGKQYLIKAKKEVILSAGAFQSPQLLMVSGIGPSNILQKHGIQTLQDLPGVGQNLQDHTYTGVSYRVNVETASSLFNDPIYASQADTSFLHDATGPLTNGPAYIAFEKLPSLTRTSRAALSASFPPDWPDIEYLIENGFDGYNDNYALADPRDGYNYATISAAGAASFSVGNVSIRSADMRDPPLINPNYLTHPIDIEMALAAFKRVRRLWEAMPGLTIGGEYFPGYANVTTDEEILRHIRASSIQLWHASATCKMGKAEDKMAVLDARARVRGMKGLRVVDASSLPFLVPGHPMATVYMLAVKIAEDILGKGGEVEKRGEEHEEL